MGATGSSVMKNSKTDTSKVEPAEQVPGDDPLDRMPTDEDLSRLQWTTVLYYLHETNPDNGLVRDKTDPLAPCSIAAVGLALALRAAASAAVRPLSFGVLILHHAGRYPTR